MSSDEPSRPAPWAVVVGAAALVLALIGGVTYAVGSLSGGGSQPADALPSGAFGLVTIDLDPPAGQKIDGFRFLRKFPALRAKVPLDGDVRKVLFDAVARQAGWTKVDYRSDVAPWLGKRVGVAVYPPTGAKGGGSPTPTVVVALQVTDAQAATAGLKRLSQATAGHAAGASLPGYVVAGDYALLAGSQAVARSMARRAESAPLADDTDFAADLAAAGDGVAVAWVDSARAGSSLGAGALPFGFAGSAAGGTGRSTLVARFAGPDVFEIVGQVTGPKAAGWATHPVTGMDTLPATSVAALGVADGDVLVHRMSASLHGRPGKQSGAMDDAVKGIEQGLGIRIPDDLAVLLGTNLVAALDRGSSGQVDLGARVSTNVAAAQRVLDTLVAAERAHGGDVPVVRRQAGGDLVVASTDREADRLSRSGTLGDVPAFHRALPDLAGADVALWLDPGKVVSAVFGADSSDRNLAAVAGVGFTVSSRHGSDTGSATYRFRLVAH
jgi:hypothetical protein